MPRKISAEKEAARDRELGKALISIIKVGDRVTFETPEGRKRTGRAVRRSSRGGWVLDCGRRQGEPGLVHSKNIISVRITSVKKKSQGEGRMMARRKTVDVRNFPIMAARCATCPFNDGGDLALRSRIEGQVLSEASQTCHSTRQANGRDTHLCRGARDFQLTIFHRLGVLSEPTDACWTKAAKGLQSKPDRRAGSRTRKGKP